MIPRSIYEVGRDVYSALQRNDPAKVERAIERFERVMSTVTRGPMSEMIDSPEVEMAVHELVGWPIVCSCPDAVCP